MKKITSIIALLFVALPGIAQDVEMADNMRSEGKIYVVVGILVTILLGLLTYLVTIDRKVSRLEKKISDAQRSKPE